MYVDQAEHRLPRLKKAYLKKCQEVEVGLSVGLVAIAIAHFNSRRIKNVKTPL